MLLQENKHLKETIEHLSVSDELKELQIYIASLKAQIIQNGGIPKRLIQIKEKYK